MVRIQVTPEELERVASSLDSHRETVEDTLNRAITEVHDLQGDWQGMAERDYMQMFDQEVPPNKKNLYAVLGEVAQKLRNAAQVLREADQAAA